MPLRGPVVHLVSAGGVVYRTSNSQIDVALCGRYDPPLWGLPKGTPAPGESVEETALREVTEETGLQVQIEAPIDTIEYWFVRSSDGARCHKQVHFYVMKAIGGDLAFHDPEFDVVRWFHAAEALRTLTYPNEARVLEKALALLDERLSQCKAK